MNAASHRFRWWLICAGALLLIGCGQTLEAPPQSSTVGIAPVAPRTASARTTATDCCRPASGAGDGLLRMPDPAAARVRRAGKVEPTVVRNASPPGPPPAGMVWIPPGRFSMGSDYAPFADARPIHTV